MGQGSLGARGLKPKYLCYENRHYEKWIRSKPCLICKKTDVQLHHVDHSRRNSFMGIPLCVEHHMPGFPNSYHQIERKAFEDRHGVCLDWLIMGLLMEYIEESK